MIEIFTSAVRVHGDLAGVFEFDGDTGYFYLYDLSPGEGTKILGAIHVVSGELDFAEHDVTVEWNDGADSVGLFIGSELWAAFVRGVAIGGNYGGSRARSPLSRTTYGFAHRS